MPNSSRVCCDANLVVYAVTGPTPARIRDVWDRWRSENRLLVAPTLLRYELTNSLHRLRLSGTLTPDAARNALLAALAFPIEYHLDDEQHVRAMELASRFNRPATYDAHYLALAERLGIEFWTADERLYNTVRHQFPWVHLVTL
jgi:predicted nucleic acid-binding protein